MEVDADVPLIQKILKFMITDGRIFEIKVLQAVHMATGAAIEIGPIHIVAAYSEERAASAHVIPRRTKESLDLVQPNGGIVVSSLKTYIAIPKKILDKKDV